MPMLYLLAVICPPLALLLTGRVISATINGLLWVAGLALSVLGIGLILVVATIVHAVAVVNGDKASKRQKQLVSAIRRSR
jgi:hypothetical protein